MICTPHHKHYYNDKINPLNAKLKPICYLLALLGAHHILHVSRIRVKGDWMHWAFTTNYMYEKCIQNSSLKTLWEVNSKT